MKLHPEQSRKLKMAVINYLPLCFDELDKGQSCYLQIQTDFEGLF